MKPLCAIIAVLWMLVAFAPSTAVAQSQQDATRLYEEALALLKKPRFIECPQTTENLKQAAQKFQEAIRIFERLGDKTKAETAYDGLGQTLEAEGFLLSIQGHLPSNRHQAVQKYEEALNIYMKAGSPKGACHTLDRLGDSVMVYERDLPRAADYYRRGLEVSTDSRDKKQQAIFLSKIGNIYSYSKLDQPDKAIEYWEKWLALISSAKEPKAHNWSLQFGEIQISLLRWGERDRRQAFAEQELALGKELRNMSYQLDALLNLAWIAKATGQHGKATDYLRNGLSVSRDFRDIESETKWLRELGIMLADLGQYDEALDCLDQGITLARKQKNKILETQLLAELGKLQAARGEGKLALTFLDQAMKLSDDIPDDTKRYFFDKKGLSRQIIDVYLDLGNLSEAEQRIMALGCSDRDVDCAALQIGRPSDRRSAPLQIGRLNLMRGDYRSAWVAYLASDSSWFGMYSDRKIAAYTGQATASEGMRLWDDAEEYYRKAIQCVEEIRSGLSAGQRLQFLDVRFNGFWRTAPYEGLARVLLQTDRPVEAFRQSEYTRARSFAEAISRRSEYKGLDIPENIGNNDSLLTDQLSLLKKNLQEASEKQDSGAIASLELQVKEAKQKLSAHINMLRDKYPLFAATKYPEPMDMAQTALKPDEWVLAYHVTDPGVIVYLTHGKTLVTAVFKPIARKDLDTLVRKYCSQMEMPAGRVETARLAAFDLTSGKKLAETLLADALPQLPKDAPLIVVPDDCLGVLPFEMLVLNQGGKVDTSRSIPAVTGAEFFGDRNPISYSQSVTALTLARTFAPKRTTGRKMLVMDDPVFGLDDERMQKMEAAKKKRTFENLPQNIMSIKTELGMVFNRLSKTSELGVSLKKLDPGLTDEYSGFNATKQQLFKTPLADYRSVVFATHGYAGTDLPGVKEPSLILTLVDQPKDQDGFLRLTEVMGLKLNADIVALTACQTGLGRKITGEGTMSLGRAFQYAGAKSVLMSLWSVSEQASVDMVESFFRHVKQGKPRLEALRLARQEIRAKGFDHPYFWAPFILVGETE